MNIGFTVIFSKSKKKIKNDDGDMKRNFETFRLFCYN